MLRALCLFFALGSIPLMAGEPSSEKKIPGFASPEEAWETYRNAHHEERWREAFECLTPAAQEHAVGGIVFTAGYLAHTKEKGVSEKITAILKKHGLDLAQIEAETKDMESKDASEYSKKMNRRVKDRGGLFVEAMAVLAPVMPRAKDKDGKRVIALGKLTKIDIAGATATGECVRKLNDGEVFQIGGVRQTEVTQEVKFTKINGRWFVNKG